MPQISIVQRKDVLQAKRFDAEHFKPEYLEVEKKLRHSQGKSINELSQQINYGVNIEPTYSEKGINFIRAQNLKEYGFGGEVLKLPFTQKDFSKNELLHEGDLLIVRSGANVGDIGVCTQDFENSTFGSYIIKFDVKDDIDPFFCYIFLKTRFGRSQTIRFRSGTAQPNISIPNLKEVLIPQLSENFQRKIREIFFESLQKQTKSKQLYKQAEQLLLQELDLVDYQPQHSLWFEVNKREVDRAGRYDAEYFQPKYSEIIEKIEKYGGGFDVAKNIVRWKKGIEVGSDAYTDEGKQFVRVSDFSIFGIENTTKKISTELFQKLKSDFQPRKGEILFTKDGTIGISSVIQKEVEGIVSVAFLRLILKTKYKNFEKKCLSLIFNSIICKLQAEQLSGGAIIEHLKPDDFGKIKIPLIQSDIQQKIADNITQSHKLREHSKQLLDTAKHAVETAIEKGEGAGAKCIVDNYEKRTKSTAKK